MFEWRAHSNYQFVRDSLDIHGKPWFSYMRFESGMAEERQMRWGLVRLILRRVGWFRRDCVVVQRLRRVPSRPKCVLSRYACKRLAWHCSDSTSEWPELEVVHVDLLKRVEQVSIDFADLSEKMGLRAMTSTAPDTAEERRVARFFRNAIYLWTTRRQVPSLWRYWGCLLLLFR